MSPDPKPAILCLHGGGTSAAIFNIQSIRLRRELGDTFDFVFIDSPWETVAGPGILPFFEGGGPFLCWVNPEVPKDTQAPQESVDVVKAAIDAQIAKTGKHFVGVMGFSEGARMAAGFALYQQQQQEEKLRQSGGSESDDETKGFLFGVFLNGVKTPLTLTPPPSLVSSLLSSAIGSTTKITLPSIHVIGAEDPWRQETRKLALNHFDQRNAKIMEFNMGHHLPTAKADSVKLANEILNLYYRLTDDF